MTGGEDFSDGFTDRATRARAWARSRDPGTLWPNLEPSLLQPAAERIEAVVASRLRDERATLGTADGRDAYTIGIAALLTGMGPLLARWVEDGSLDVSDALAAVLAGHLAHGRARAERITRGLIGPLEQLAAAGVTPLLIKGYHTAHTYFAEPGVRPIADVDLIVAPDEIARAEGALRAAQFTPAPFAQQPYKRDWLPPDDDDRLWSLELFDARDRWQIELHDGPNFGFLVYSDFRLASGIDPRTRWNVGGVSVAVPGQPMLTILLAAHLSAELNVRRLMRLTELILVMRRDCQVGGLKWDELDAALMNSNATRFVYPAFALVEKLAPGTVDPTFLTRGRKASTRLSRFLTDRYTPTVPVLEELLADRLIFARRLMWVSGPRDLSRVVARWLNPYPDRSWYEGLGHSYDRLKKLASNRFGRV